MVTFLFIGFLYIAFVLMFLGFFMRCAANALKLKLCPDRHILCILSVLSKLEKVKENTDSGFILFSYICQCSVPVFLNIKLETMRYDNTKAYIVDFPAFCTAQPVTS